MNTESKINMYRGKKLFIEELSKAFVNVPGGHSVTSVSYEVYSKPYGDNVYYIEYVIVNFQGGGKCVAIANGNSNTANFRVIGRMLDGGYYDEIYDYENLLNNGFIKVNL